MDPNYTFTCALTDHFKFDVQKENKSWFFNPREWTASAYNDLNSCSQQPYKGSYLLAC